MPSPRAVELAGVSHAYDGDAVLVDVSLEVGAGEPLALLGPSGCGKTTLLRTIAGLERPTAGTICLGDRVVADGSVWVPPERRRVGMVFQDWALFPHLNVGRNVAYGLDRSQRSGSRVTDALTMVGLAGFEDRMPSSLSGGEQQRVALARALAPQPSVLLLDEPFSNLDTSMRLEVRGEVHRLLLELGVTSIFVTHDQEEAFVVGDRIAVMREGRIVQVDTPQELYAEPHDRWVAEFVGTASLLRGEASAAVATTPIGSIPLATDIDGPVDVLLRPEQLVLTSGSDATVDLIEFYGHDAMVFVSIDGDRLRVRTEPDVRARRGDKVGVSFTGVQAIGFPRG